MGVHRSHPVGQNQRRSEGERSLVLNNPKNRSWGMSGGPLREILRRFLIRWKGVSEKPAPTVRMRVLSGPPAFPGPGNDRIYPCAS